MTQALEQRTYTREDYLEFETASEERHEYEYVNGEIRPMTGELLTTALLAGWR